MSERALLRRSPFQMETVFLCDADRTGLERSRTNKIHFKTLLKEAGRRRVIIIVM